MICQKDQVLTFLKNISQNFCLPLLVAQENIYLAKAGFITGVEIKQTFIYMEKFHTPDFIAGH